MTQGYDPNERARLFDTFEDDADASYGFQATARFLPTDAKPKQVVDAMNRFRLSLWRVAAHPAEPGVRWDLRLIYGTASTLSLNNIEAPLVAYVPGNLQLYALPVSRPEGQTVAIHVSLKPVNGYNLQHVRTRAVAGISPVDLPGSGVRFTALAASTVTVAGVAVVLAAGQTLPLMAPAILGAGGSGIVEHEL